MLYENMTVGRLGRTRRVVAALFVLVFLVLGTLGASTPALAGQLATSGGQKNPSGSGYITFGIQPSGPRQPDQRSWFIYTLKPGSTLEDWVAVTNFSLTPLRVNLYARDAEESSTGAFGIQLFRQRPVQVGSWIHLPVSSVVVQPRKALIIPFTIKVPQDASPGDDAGGIVASIIRTAVGAHRAVIRVEQRVGVRVYARILGPLHPKLVISGLVSHYTGTWSPLAGGTHTVTYTVRNVGNLDLSAPSVLRLSNPFGWSRTVRQTGNPPDVFPGFSIQVTRIIHGVYPAFRVDTTVTVHPAFSTVSTDSGLDETALHLGSVSASTGTWAIPWPPLGLLLLLIVAVASAIYIRSRRRRADRRAHAEPPQAEAVPV